jgi:hypothetical protein
VGALEKIADLRIELSQIGINICTYICMSIYINVWICMYVFRALEKIADLRIDLSQLGDYICTYIYIWMYICVHILVDMYIYE